MKHKILIGENLKILNNLKDKFDLIYIDPPYNTKNNSNKLYSDYINNWIDFMKSRLEIAKDLLNKDAFIFISINENYICELKLLCDSVFSKENKVAMFSVKTPNQTAGTYVIKNTEYLLIYRKSSSSRFNLQPKEQEARCTTGKSSQKVVTIEIPKGVRVINVPDGTYSNYDVLKFNAKEDIEIVGQDIVVKNGRLHRKVKIKARWSCPNDVKNWISNFKNNNAEKVFNKYGKQLDIFYLSGMRFQPRMLKTGFETPTTFLDKFQSKGSVQLKEIIGENDFKYSKDINFIKYIISIGTSKCDAKVLDFFGGSGTTLQAVAELNKENNTNMCCTLITNNENNIADSITIPRINVIQTGIRPDGTKYSDGLDFEYSLKRFD